MYTYINVYNIYTYIIYVYIMEKYVYGMENTSVK